MAASKSRTILFLCTGNYYRSRFAEVLFNSVAARMGLPWRANSRALALERGVNNVGPMAPAAIRALEAMGIRAALDCGRLPAQVTDQEISDAARVIALKQVEHLPLVQERYPDWHDKIEYWHIDDAPEVLPLIEQQVMTLVAALLGGGGPAPAQPREPAPATAPARRQLRAKVGRETAGRRGKGVTTVFDLDLDAAALQELAGLLKQRCGTGGTVKEGRIEIQGDQRERVIAELEKLGYQVKRAGG
jgi:protein-tyrosine phosphatase